MISVRKIIDYMNNKYEDDKFHYASSAGSSSVLMSSDKFPDARILVLYSRDNGADSFADNYLYYKYEEQFTQLIEEILREAFAGMAK